MFLVLRGLTGTKIFYDILVFVTFKLKLHSCFERQGVFHNSTTIHHVIIK